MLGNGADPVVWAVAGCLFEVSVPEIGGTSWTWVNPRPEVTLLSESMLGQDHHFRFRAESPGAVELRFRSHNAVRAVVMRVVAVHVAPEEA